MRYVCAILLLFFCIGFVLSRKALRDVRALLHETASSGAPVAVPSPAPTQPQTFDGGDVVIAAPLGYLELFVGEEHHCVSFNWQCLDKVRELRAACDRLLAGAPVAVPAQQCDLWKYGCRCVDGKHGAVPAAREGELDALLKEAEILR